MVVLLGARGETGGIGGAVLATSVSAGVAGLYDILALADVVARTLGLLFPPVVIDRFRRCEDAASGS